MNNRMALQQAREAIAFHIAQSPETITGERFPLIDNGFGVFVPDPFGTPVQVSDVVRISHEKSGVRPQQESPAGLDTSLSLWVLAPHTVTLIEGETKTARGRMFKVGVVDALEKFGGVQAYQAPLIPAGDVPSVAVTGVTLNGDDPEQALTVAGTFQLIATVSPESAVDKSVSWLSGDESVATVDADGLVTGVSPGFALILVTTNEGAFTANRLFQVVP